MVKDSTLLKSINPHDLLEIESPESIDHIDSAPSWVRHSLSLAPYVVVRRAAGSDDRIAIGVRGNGRDKRWPGFVRPQAVKNVLSPYQLRLANAFTNVLLDANAQLNANARLDTVPALRHLQSLEDKWRLLEYQWGPGGSVGFELASGYPAASATSDLDIVLFAPSPFDHEHACSLLRSAQEISMSIDVIVETPTCAFLLGEYVAARGAPILLRYTTAPRLGSSPWQSVEEAETEA